jgi:hypothetical protein
MKNIVEWVQGEDYKELEENINATISNTQFFRVKQIDYFNIEKSYRNCTAFILFEEIED